MNHREQKPTDKCAEPHAPCALPERLEQHTPKHELLYNRRQHNTLHENHHPVQPVLCALCHLLKGVAQLRESRSQQHHQHKPPNRNRYIRQPACQHGKGVLPEAVRREPAHLRFQSLLHGVQV